MLVLSRRDNETLHIGDARIVIKRSTKGRVTLAIDAPPSVKVLRGEVAGQAPKPKAADR